MSLTSSEQRDPEQAARIEACPHCHGAIPFTAKRAAEEHASWKSGFESGQEVARLQRRPDAAAIAAAEQRGRESVLAVVRDKRDHHDHTRWCFCEQINDALDAILRACGEGETA